MRSGGRLLVANKKAFCDGLVGLLLSHCKLLRYERQTGQKRRIIIKRTVEKPRASDAGKLLSLIEYIQWMRRTLRKLASGFQETVRKRGFFNVRLLNDFLMSGFALIVEDSKNMYKCTAY